MRRRALRVLIARGYGALDEITDDSMAQIGSIAC
jgi:hypothetical protein